MKQTTIIGLDVGGPNTAVVEGTIHGRILQLIVLGSSAVVLGERVLASALAQGALLLAVAACEALPSALGKDVGDVAALMAPLNHSRPVPIKNYIQPRIYDT